MCGIFGILCTPDARLDGATGRALVVALLRASETRGREAVGLAVHDGTQINVLKQGGSVADFLKNPRLGGLLSSAFAQRDGAVNGHRRPLAITGHSRLVTNGFQSNQDNNQPVITPGAVALHNGIVVNDRALIALHPSLSVRGDVDSEVLAALLRSELDRSGDLVAATRATFAEIEGSASIAMLFDDRDQVLLATNTGSLFQLADPATGVVVFASERFILQKMLDERSVSGGTIEQLPAGRGMVLQLQDLARHTFSLAGEPAPPSVPPASTHGRVPIVNHSSNAGSLRRCTRCILPETYPFVAFDNDGVCFYCRTWKKIEVTGEEALRSAVEPYRSKDGSPDVIVAFSGGRDSSYGLHYVKKVLGMNPVAFTYDWGLVTDLARRNQARICGKLGVEHILRAADITSKRRYVRKNVEAWLRKPELGMVTLFMAGDKEFYSYARALRKETGIKLVIFCTGNMIEDAPYKTGLMGIPQDDHGNVLTKMSLRNKSAMLAYFAKQYAANPSYVNESLKDTWNAFWQTFVIKDDFLYLYKYIRWDEKTIVNTIRSEYNWEIETDTTTTWRIGDGTAAFYNYIYQTIAGFTEDDCMLANMVREGDISRDEAMQRSAEYAIPRWRSIREYAQLIGFSAEEALQIINAAPKLY
jgi:glucosamine--fructose-6-phosphate aminotransferase (isomerizing)